MAVILPLDYWLHMVGYIRQVEDIRATLETEGRLFEQGGH